MKVFGFKVFYDATVLIGNEHRAGAPAAQEPVNVTKMDGISDLNTEQIVRNDHANMGGIRDYGVSNGPGPGNENTSWLNVELLNFIYMRGR